MRSLLISIVAFTLVLGSWGVFIVFADDSIHSLHQTIKKEAMLAINQEDWVKAEKSLGRVSAQWYQGRRVFSLFFNAQAIAEVEASVVRAQAYISAEEKASSLGELAYLDQQLMFLLENEKLTLENVM